jgi:PAS domain S-box-containing protein
LKKKLWREEHKVIEAIPQQIWTGPADGSLDYCNRLWLVYAGMELKDIQGEGWQRILHPHDRDRVLNAWRESLVNGTPYKQEERHRSSDGTYRWFLCRGLPVTDAEGRIERWYGANTEIEDRKRAEAVHEGLVAERREIVSLLNHHVRNALQVLKFAQNFQPEMQKFATFVEDAVARIEWVLREITIYDQWNQGSQSGQSFGCNVVDITTRRDSEDSNSTSINRKLIYAQEQERIRIARDLHDDVGQRIALIAIQLSQMIAISPPYLRDHVCQMQSDIEELAANLQHLSHELHSSTLEYLGLVAAMRRWCSEFGEKRKMKVDFHSSGMPNVLPPEISLCLFRVLQEALQNAAKHSGATHFEVQLGKDSHEIYLTVRDFGAGFDPEATGKGRGLGLTSMRERLALLNGYMFIESQPKHGTTINARVPFSSGADFARAAG